MATRTHLTAILMLLISVTLFSWYVGTGGGAHPMAPNLTISAVVLFIALLKVRLIMSEFMDVGTAPAWVRRASNAWLMLFFAALFVVHFTVSGN